MFFDITGHDFQNMGWVEKSFVFTATGVMTTLAFASQTSNDNNSPGFGPALDNVKVDPAIPEPASLLLPGSGLAGLGAPARFRRRS